MKTYGRIEVQLYSFITSALYGCKWLHSRDGRFNLWKRAPESIRIGGKLGLIAGFDVVEKRKIVSHVGIRILTPQPSNL
jgi:hypothetical protein